MTSFWRNNNAIITSCVQGNMPSMRTPICKWDIRKINSSTQTGPNTIDSRYIAVQNNTMLHTAQQPQNWNFAQSLYSPDSKVHGANQHGANMGPTGGRQDPGGPHVGPMLSGSWRSIHRLHSRVIVYLFLNYLAKSDCHIWELWCLFFVILNRLLNKQSDHWWFETPWRSCDVTVIPYLTSFPDSFRQKYFWNFLLICQRLILQK